MFPGFIHPNMTVIFDIVAHLLNQIAKWTHLTYNEINIIVYYLLIPFSWTVMGDFIIGFPILTPILLGIWLYLFIKKRHTFRMWCDRVFQDSVKFLLWFKKIGWNYIVSSVIICVFVPILIYGGLIWLLIR